MSIPYGVAGCRCRIEPGILREATTVTYTDNPHCPYHGILPRDRTDTGVYRVVTSEPVDIDLGTMRRAVHRWNLDDRLREGIEQAERGETVDRGVFSQHLDPGDQTKNWRLQDGCLVADIAAPGDCPIGYEIAHGIDDVELTESLEQYRRGKVLPARTFREEPWWRRLAIRLRWRKEALFDGIG